jgi:hypothetical protein
MKKKRRKSKRKGGRRCSVRHIVKCRSGKRRKTRRKARKTRSKGAKRGGKGAYARHVKAMWRKHRKKLTALGFKRASKYISSTYKR